LRFIIELFKEPGLNKNNAQLIFTSHDLVTMSNDVFRRDEILFAAKNENQESELYSLYEIRDEEGKSVNKNSSYSKQYLEGRYGSDPYFQKIHSF
jgi:AAA15 family ATPase/GTPase